MRDSDKVRVINGKNNGKIGKIIAAAPRGQPQDVTHGQDITTEGEPKYWVVEFEDGKQDVLEEKDLENLH